MLFTLAKKVDTRHLLTALQQAIMKTKIPWCYLLKH